MNKPSASDRPLAGCHRPPATMQPVGIVAHSVVTAAGLGVAALASALAEGRSALVPNTWSRVPLQTWLGRIPAIDDEPLPARWADWDCRATRAAWIALHIDGFVDQVRATLLRLGAGRVGLVLGTSASTIAITEQAYGNPGAGQPVSPAARNERLNTLHGVTDFVQQVLGVQGPAATVATACSSSAKVFAQAERWLRLGLVDAVVVGGVDTLCESLLFGFQSLGLLSPEPCRPFAAARSGISIGEGAGFALLQRTGTAWRLRGWGESNDAHHMSSPHPQGLGAERALHDALARAGLDAAQVDYLNLHGTGTPRNDEVEAALVTRSFAPGVHASATKGVTGHTMGAAGIVEAIVCLIALHSDLSPGTTGTPQADPSLGPGFAVRLRRASESRRIDVAVSHSFGFGGNNCVLVFDRGP
jgi:3-oxoacyl-[acyl-carrier-protein] synthase-1